MAAKRPPHRRCSQSTTFNGIDFVEVANDARRPTLRVHFLNGA